MDINIKDNKILITLCARGGSKGIPGKNTRLLNGIPLIAYSINTAKIFIEKYNADIILSTDSEEIKDIASEFGLYTDYIRPAVLATDKAGKIPAIKDVLLYQENKNNIIYDFIIDLDVTAPLRTVTDLENAFCLLLKTEDAFNIFSVSPANRNPYFNMVEPDEKGFYHLSKEGHIIKSRQTAPLVYDMNASFYIYRRKFFDSKWEIAITDKSLAYIVPHTCFDLDHPMDFTIMELLIKEKLLDFEF